MEIADIGFWLGGFGLLQAAIVSAVLWAVMRRAREGAEWLLFALLPVSGVFLGSLWAVLAAPFVGRGGGGILLLQGGNMAISLLCLVLPLLAIRRGLGRRGG